MKKGNKSEAANLRQKAEELLIKKSLKTDSQLSETDIHRLNHELQVHQIELEMQNEELRLANEQAEFAAKKYTKLYDFAPSGYFILSKEGNVIDLNLSGRNILGKKLSGLKNISFDFFVSNETKPIFNTFLSKAFNSKAEESCEITLSTYGNLPMYVSLNGIVTENSEQCFVNMMNITDGKRAAELIIANKELAYQNEEKEKRAGELIIANKELTFQNIEKEKRAAELIIANKELTFQIIERKQAEEALRESEEKFKFYTDNAPMAVVEWDSDFLVKRWTGDSEKIFGWNSEEVVGKKIMDLDIIYEPDIPMVQKTIEKLTSGLFKIENGYKTKDLFV